MQTELLVSPFNETLRIRSWGTIGGVVQCFFKELCIWIIRMVTTDKRLVLPCFYKHRELRNLVYVKRAGAVWKLSPKIIYLRGKRDRTVFRRAHFLSLSLTVFVWCYGSMFTCTRTGEHRLLVVTLAWRHLERSRYVILTAGHILNNDNGHLL